MECYRGLDCFTNIPKLQNQIIIRLKINFFFLEINYIFNLHLILENRQYRSYKV